MSDDEVNLYLASFALQIEAIMNTLDAQQSDHHFHGKQLFYDLSIVSGTDFYGFHQSPEPLIKITAVDPADVPRIVEIVRSGVINDCVYEPYESHIPFLLHFVIDHNLYGMNFVYFKSPCFRQPVPSTLHIPIHLRSSKVVQRRSLCALEMDVVDQHLLNSQWVSTVNLKTADLSKQRLVPSLREIWNEEK